MLLFVLLLLFDILLLLGTIVGWLGDVWLELIEFWFSDVNEFGSVVILSVVL